MANRFLFLLAFSFFLWLPEMFAQSKYNDTLSVGVYNNAPKIFISESGEAKGLFIDIIKNVAAEKHWYLDFRYGEWNQLITDLERGELDVLPDMAFSAERDSIYKFASLPVIGSWLEVFTNTPDKIKAVVDLDGKKLGLIKGSVQENYFSERANKDFDISYDLIIFGSQQELMDALNKGDIDAIVGDRFLAFSEQEDFNLYSSGIVLQPTELFLAFSPTTPNALIENVDSHISALKNNPNSAYYSALNNWLDRETKSFIPPFVKWAMGVLVAILTIVIGYVVLLDYNVRKKTAELKLRNEELQTSKQKAEESERLKTAFLQNMSHEIRTPMNGIIGFMRLLQQPDLEAAQQKKYIDIVIRSGNRLLTTINNIIEFSKINSSQVELHPAPLNLRELMSYHYHFFKLHATDRGLEMEIEKQVKPAEAYILCDKNILDGVLTNLINNAIKFTKKGKISIGNFIEGDRLIFFVKDTGIGIPGDKREAIFKPFVQGNENLNRPYEGSGLGLSIVREHLKLISGEIWVDSTPGQGSTFYFSIPYHPSAEIPLAEEQNNSFYSIENPGKVLVAEDDNISFMLISQLLKEFGCEVIRAGNGREAINKFKDTQNLAFILMDMKMPDINGLEATRAIREVNKTIPIIAQTAYTQQEDINAFLKAGCNDYITKPIHRENLMHLIQKYMLSV